MNIMFDQSFPVTKQDLPVTLKHENVIYVFEDVDAASKIVLSRKLVSKDVPTVRPPTSAAGAAAVAPASDPTVAAAVAAGVAIAAAVDHGSSCTSPRGGGAATGKDAAADGEKYGDEYDKLDLSVGVCRSVFVVVSFRCYKSSHARRKLIRCSSRLSLKDRLMVDGCCYCTRMTLPPAITMHPQDARRVQPYPSPPR